MKAKASKDAPLPRRVNGPSMDAPWCEETADILRARPDETLVWVLTNLDGAQDLAHGIVPRHVKRQAKSALVWNFE